MRINYYIQYYIKKFSFSFISAPSDIIPCIQNFFSLVTGDFWAVKFKFGINSIQTQLNKNINLL